MFREDYDPDYERDLIKEDEAIEYFKELEAKHIVPIDESDYEESNYIPMIRKQQSRILNNLDSPEYIKEKIEQLDTFAHLYNLILSDDAKKFSEWCLDQKQKLEELL